MLKPDHIRYICRRMNFLAHMLLSCDDDALLTGNFLGDLLRNREIARLPQPVREGIQLHRQIDSFTDIHPMVRQGTRRLHPRHGKYAPVLIDVYYDYLLSLHWEKFSEVPLRAFTREVYLRLLRYQEVMPPRVQQQLRAMAQDDWLMTYSTYRGLEDTFMRLRARVSRPEQLIGAVDSLRVDQPLFEAEFLQFFPDIQSFVQQQIVP